MTENQLDRTSDVLGVAGGQEQENGSTSSKRGWYVVAVLLLLNVFSWMDRQIIVLLIDPIRHDLGISEVQIALLVGFAFAILYAACGFLFGWAVDRFNRRWLICLGVLAWSLATVICGLSRSFWQLFAGRIAVGVGEGILSPATSSLLSDIFPAKRLALANSVVAMGAALGVGISFAIGGLVAGIASHGEVTMLPLIGEVRVWQVAFIVVGLPGPVLALLALTIQEPKRTGTIHKTLVPGSSAYSVGFLGFLRSHWHFYALHNAGFALIGMGSNAMLVWGPTYLMRAFGWDAAQVGTRFGGAMAFSMVASFLLSGFLVDFLFARGMKGVHLRLYSIVAILCLPVAVGSIAIHDPWLFLTAFFVYKLLIGGYGPVGITCLLIVTPNEFRGRVAGMFLFVGVLGGLGFGPLLVALTTQYVFMDERMVGWSLALVLMVLYPLASLLLWFGAKFQCKIQDAKLS